MYNHCFVLANKYQHADFPNGSIRKIAPESGIEDFEGGDPN
jgi:hypothetical protein